MTKTLKQKLNEIIKEEQELKLKLEQLQGVKEVIAGELLDSVHSDSYSMSNFTVYRKKFYKLEITDQRKIENLMVQKLVLDNKEAIKLYTKNGSVDGLKVTEDTRVIVRTKSEEN